MTYLALEKDWKAEILGHLRTWELGAGYDEEEGDPHEREIRRSLHALLYRGAAAMLGVILDEMAVTADFAFAHDGDARVSVYLWGHADLNTDWSKFNFSMIDLLTGAVKDAASYCPDPDQAKAFAATLRDFAAQIDAIAGPWATS